MRFIGNLHSAMRVTDGEKKKVKELNALLRENPEYGRVSPTAKYPNAKQCSKSRCKPFDVPYARGADLPFDNE